jgi:hypothetical protein
MAASIYISSNGPFFLFERLSVLFILCGKKAFVRAMLCPSHAEGNNNEKRHSSAASLKPLTISPPQVETQKLRV